MSIHSFSNLRMTASVTQNDYAPGSTLQLRASLKEYNLPVEKRATVQAELEYPDHSRTTLSFAEIQPGIFETTTVGAMPGIYRFNAIAKISRTRARMLPASSF